MQKQPLQIQAVYRKLLFQMNVWEEKWVHQIHRLVCVVNVKLSNLRLAIIAEFATDVLVGWIIIARKCYC